MENDHQDFLMPQQVRQEDYLHHHQNRQTHH
jgi:hypothetical protein